MIKTISPFGTFNCVMLVLSESSTIFSIQLKMTIFERKRKKLRRTSNRTWSNQSVKVDNWLSTKKIWRWIRWKRCWSLQTAGNSLWHINPIAITWFPLNEILFGYHWLNGSLTVPQQWMRRRNLEWRRKNVGNLNLVVNHIDVIHRFVHWFNHWEHLRIHWLLLVSYEEVWNSSYNALEQPTLIEIEHLLEFGSFSGTFFFILLFAALHIFLQSSCFLD